VFLGPDVHRCGARTVWSARKSCTGVLFAAALFLTASAAAHKGAIPKPRASVIPASSPAASPTPAPVAPIVPGAVTEESLTQALIDMSGQYRAATPAERRGLESSLLTVAATRRQVLASLMEDDPGAVLAAALPADVRSDLPAALTALLELDVELEGTLEILHEDSQSGSRFDFFLHTAGGRHSLHFADGLPTHLLTGARIRAKGVQVGTALALGDGGGGVTVQQSAPTLNALGEQRTLLILVNFADAPTQPYTPATAQSVLFGTTSQFYRENSFQQTWLGGDVVGWFTIAATSTACDMDGIATQATSAAVAAGVNLAAYAHHIYAFPQNYSCSFWGRSSVGGSPSQAWINGDFELGVTAHEFGHGLGLWHSHSIDCGTETLGSNCTTYEYGDTIDMMGASSFAHFNAFQKERLGWLNAGASPPITTVTTGGTYTLETFETAGTGPKALKILKSTDPTSGARTWYYIQSRQAIGFDAQLAGNANVLNGVLIHVGTESKANSSSLLDLTPGSGSTIAAEWNDPALVAGRSFSDPVSGVTMTTQWVSATAAAVTVQFTGSGTTPTPDVTIATDQPTYSVNQSVSLKATVTSNGSPVAKAPVTFTIKKSSGAVVTGTATTGPSGVATYKYRIGRKDPVGLYEANAAALSRNAVTNFMVQ
jgi:Gametolysin peptidase M11